MKQIVKNFNNLIKKTIFNVQNKTNNNFKISNFNRYLITVVSVLFSYLFYLLIPILYDKTWVQTNIEKKLFNEFKINLSASADISYRILPAPHFLIKDSKILLRNTKNNQSIADVKNLKVFVSQKNLFDKDKMNLKRVIINKANFLFLRSDLKIFNESSNNQFSNKQIIIDDSSIFFKNNAEEIITIVKINKANLFFDNEKKINLFKLKGEVFAVPFIFNFKNKNSFIKNKQINFEAKSLMLNIFNESIKDKDSSFSGKNTISFLNSTINTKFNIKEKLIIFESNNYRKKNSNLNYDGELSINPFDLYLNIDLGNFKISKLFNINPILTEFFHSTLPFNENISVNVSAISKTNLKSEIFQSAKVNFRIINGKINFDNTRFINDDIGSLKLNNSDLIFKDDNLILSTDILVDIKNSDYLFSFLNTKKSSRKNLKNISINLDYNFSTNQIKVHNIRIDNNKMSNYLLTIIDSFNDNNFNNLNKTRRLLNDLLNAYEG
jgi:hypothetical protein